MRSAPIFALFSALLLAALPAHRPLLRAEDSVAVESVVTAPGNTVDVRLLLDHEQAFQSAQFSLAYDGALLTLTEITSRGTDIEHREIETFVTSIEPEARPGFWRANAGLVLSVDPWDDPVLPGTHSVLAYRFDTPGDPVIPGSCVTLDLVEGSAANLTDGQICFETCATQDPELPVFYLDSPGASGGRLELEFLEGGSVSFEVTARLRTPLDDTDGWSLSVQHDPEVLTLEDVTHDGTDTLTDFLKLVFAFVWTADGPEGSGFTAYAVNDMGLGGFVAAGDYSLVRAKYRLVEPAGCAGGAFHAYDRATTIRFQDGLRPQREEPFPNSLTSHGETVPFCTEALRLRLETIPEPEFARGDANLDETIDISDPVTILRAQFTEADTVIRCADAADTNDDGKIDISDAIYVFRYLFMGAAPPSQPFPEAGLDSTEDVFSCCEL